WPLRREQLEQLHKLMEEQLAAGHITPSRSPWNTLVFCIPKKNGRWHLLHDLRAVNAVIEPMGALQPGFPSPSMLPANWPLTVIDLKDCFFTLFLHPEDAPRFAFSDPSLNQQAPMQRYHWTVLPQGMHNSPMICQAVVDAALHPVRVQNRDAIIYHYMGNILIAAPYDNDLEGVVAQVYKAIEQAGLHISPDKVQKTSPWKYLGWQTTQQEIRPQPLCIKLNDIVTLNELQKILGAINWLRPVLGLTTEELHPLFTLL
ncbi:hypothetical protein N324_02947, partial [Chlamydotis macqueenii]